MTENYSTDAMEVIRNSRNIKKEVVQFHKIELGLNNENPVFHIHVSSLGHVHILCFLNCFEIALNSDEE